MFRIGIVGTGSTFGIAHYHALGVMQDKRAAVAAVYSSSTEKAVRWVCDHNLSAVVCRSYEELLSKVDAVVICTPNSYHCSMALQAAGAGKHLLVEKPVAVSAEECEMLKKTCLNNGKTGMVGFAYRFSGAVQEARKLVSQRMGEIYLFSAWLGGRRLADPSLPIEWRMRRKISGSGALGDFGSHAVDLAAYLCNQRYEEVSCMTQTFIKDRLSDGVPAEVENDDVALFMGRGPNGMGSFSMSRIGMVEPRFVITGEGGLVEIDLSGTGSVSYMEKKPSGKYLGETKGIGLEKPNDFQAMISAQMTAFIDSMEGKPAPVADVAQGCYVESVLLAAEASSETGCRQGVI
ncbi:MAG: Gfo/Idh/MocA family oxidoreductase [Spirochaetales bacterium]|nr:Gfo/Idh/MocA family oxidoreductase [Spirochaetales bacterium]